MPQFPLHRPAWMTTDRIVLAVLLMLALVVRGGVLWAMRGNLEQDPDAYREIAENLLRHGEFALGKPSGGASVSPPVPTAYRPPLYPIVLSNLPAEDGQSLSLAKVAALHLALGVATVWLTWLTARRVFFCTKEELATDETRMKHGFDASGSSVQIRVSSVAPLLAGLLVACDPILLNQQTLIMTETLAAFLAILSLWCLARFDTHRSWFSAALAGGAIGLAVLCRPTFLPWLLLVAGAMLVGDFRFRIADCGSRLAGRGFAEGRWRTIRDRLGGFGWRLAYVAALAIGAAAIISPWAIRNYRVFGEPIVTTTHGGYTFWLGNNESFYRWLTSDRTGLPWTPDREPSLHERFRARIGRDQSLEVTLDSVDYGIAKLEVSKHPYEFALACMYRIGQLWLPLPHKLSANESAGRRLLRYVTCLWYCTVYLLAAVGVWRLRRKLLTRQWLWGVLLCLAFTAVHTLYWTNLRMRAPLMPFVALVAAAAVPATFSRRAGEP